MRNLLAALLLALPLPALAWEEPARGTPLRADLMDSVRPLLEWNLGEPVEIVVHLLRVRGDLAFLSGYGQRPGGVAIDLQATPMARRGEYYPEVSDGTSFQALLRRSGQMWVAVQWAQGATDVWFASPEYCDVWRPVLAEYCN